MQDFRAMGWQCGGSRRAEHSEIHTPALHEIWKPPRRNAGDEIEVDVGVFETKAL
jgi:hypothetical protein